MAAPALSEEAARLVVSLVEDCLREGYCPPNAPSAGRAALTEAGRRAIESGMVRTTGAFRSRYDTARVSHGIEPDWSLWRPAQYQAIKQTKRSPSGAHDAIPHDLAEPEGKAVKVLAIGDCHDDPRLPDKTRFKWFGRCAADRKVDRIVQIGDWCSWDSVSRHEDRATIRGRALPSFEDDLGSFRMSLRALDEGLDGYECDKDETEGNHEARIQTYENLHPVMEGGMMIRMREALAQYGWRSRPFGEFLMIEGVAFTHVPLTIMGKPYGGKHLNQIANDSIFSLVFGHSHKGGHLPAPKIGPSCKIDILNIGCALPHGHVEDYAKLSTTGWQYGVYELTLRNGQIENHKHISMIELREKYGE
jgi:hypothetical protein